MSIGHAVRRRLGRFEQPAAEAYRSLFIDLGDFARRVTDLVPTARRILEIGCGDGSVADRLAAAYPDAEYVGIDVAPDPGRRYTGDRGRARFASMTSGELRAGDPAPFDLTVIVDVLHHVPADRDRRQLVADAAAMTHAGGTVLVKEWERRRHLGYLAGATCDRYVSGDRQTRFMDRAELLELLGQAAGELSVTDTTTVRPWVCNSLLAMRRTASTN